MTSKQQTIVAGHLLSESPCKWAILFNRGGYVNVNDQPLEIQRSGRLVKEVLVDGVWLARVYRLE